MVEDLKVDGTRGVSWSSVHLAEDPEPPSHQPWILKLWVQLSGYSCTAAAPERSIFEHDAVREYAEAWVPPRRLEATHLTFLSVVRRQSRIRLCWYLNRPGHTPLLFMDTAVDTSVR